MHGERMEDLAAFRRAYLASDAWAQLCAQHSVVQVQPAAQ